MYGSELSMTLGFVVSCKSNNEIKVEQKRNCLWYNP
jgi:hypothetical protein